MLTISKPLSASQARRYHEEEFQNARENYYTEGDLIRGVWYGELAHRWNLVGEVREEHFGRLAEGQHPMTGEPLVRHQTAQAKGANRWRNVMSQLGGRKVQIGQETFYAMQGRREYLQEIARLMSASSNPLDVQRAGTEVLGALQRNEIEYYITSAKFAGKRMRRTVQRGLVWGVSKFVRVWRAVL